MSGISSIEELTISQVQSAVAAGQISYTELVSAYLDRISVLDRGKDRLGAITYVNENAVDDARKADAQLKTGRSPGRLHGIPLLLKDNINTVDLATSNGSAVLRGFVPPYDAFIARRLRAEGAIILGKASMGEFAGGSYNSIDGVIRNPYHPKRAPSGSSAGSAVAVTANLAMVAIGTDTSTSIRGPAAMAGIVGLRPTTGLLSRTGIAPKNLAFDTAGPMTRTVTDAAILLGAMSGRDGHDPLSVSAYEHFAEDCRDSRDFKPHLRRGALKGARLGVVRNFFGGDPEVDALTEWALDAMRSLGAVLVDLVLDQDFIERHIDNSTCNIRRVMDFSFRQDFEKYLATLGPGAPASVEAFVEIYEAVINRSPLPAEPSVMDLLRTSLSTSLTDPKYAEVADGILPAATSFKRKLFHDNRLNAMVFPAKTGFASEINTPVLVERDPTFVPPAHPWESPLVFAAYSSVGNPEIVVPIGSGSQGMPIAISIMGRPWHDGEVLGFAFDYEQETLMRRAPNFQESAKQAI